MAVEGRFLRDTNKVSRVFVDSSTIKNHSISTAINLVDRHIKNITNCRKISPPWSRNPGLNKPATKDINVFLTGNSTSSYANINMRQVFIPADWLRLTDSKNSLLVISHEIAHIIIPNWAPHRGNKSRNVFNKWKLESKKTHQSRKSLFGLFHKEPTTSSVVCAQSRLLCLS